jgi:hypothetical protein
MAPANLRPKANRLSRPGGDAPYGASLLGALHLANHRRSRQFHIAVRVRRRLPLAGPQAAPYFSRK